MTIKQHFLYNESMENNKDFDIKNIEYLNKYSIKELQLQIDAFKDSQARKELKWYVNRKVERKIICENNKTYYFTIYQYYFFDENNKKQYITYYPKEFRYLTKLSYDLKLSYEAFLQKLHLIRNAYSIISHNLGKYHYFKHTKTEEMKEPTPEEETADSIYISYDDCYHNLREKQEIVKSNVKIFKIFSNRRKLNLIVNERYLSNDKKLNNRERAAKLFGIIYHFFKVNGNTKLYLLTDNGVGYNNLAKNLTATHILDAYHFKHNFNQTLKIKDTNIKQLGYQTLGNQRLFFNEKLTIREYLLDYDNDIVILKNKIRIILDNQPLTCLFKNALTKLYNYLDAFNQNNTTHIDNITAQAEATVSLYKSLFKKAYATYGVKCLNEIIRLNKNNFYYLN